MSWIVLPGGGGQRRLLGILDLHLTDGKPVGPYKRYDLEVRLRAGIQIWLVTSSDPEPLARLVVRAKSNALARFEAESQAKIWLNANLESLCTPP